MLNVRATQCLSNCGLSTHTQKLFSESQPISSELFWLTCVCQGRRVMGVEVGLGGW